LSPCLSTSRRCCRHCASSDRRILFPRDAANAALLGRLRLRLDGAAQHDNPGPSLLTAGSATAIDAHNRDRYRLEYEHLAGHVAMLEDELVFALRQFGQARAALVNT
jgi:hypothetical protein